MIRAEGPAKTPLHPEQKSNKIEYYHSGTTYLKESACMILHVIFFQKNSLLDYDLFIWKNFKIVNF